MTEVSPDGSSAPTPAERPRAERILDAVGDPVVRAILGATHARSMTVQELFQTTGAPLTTLYRKVHELQSIDLVGVERSAITPDGKRVEFYRSRVEEAQIELRDGRFVLRARYRNLSALRMEGLWGAVREEARR